jgi:hypothetical protein
VSITLSAPSAATRGKVTFAKANAASPWFERESVSGSLITRVELENQSMQLEISSNARPAVLSFWRSASFSLYDLQNAGLYVGKRII